VDPAAWLYKITAWRRYVHRFRQAPWDFARLRAAPKVMRNQCAYVFQVHTGYGPKSPSPTPSLFSDAVQGVVFRCWVPTSRCRARLTLRSTPTRTRRALFGRHAAADGLWRIISGLAGCVRTAGAANSISSFSSNDSLGRPHLHSPPLRVESSLLMLYAVCI
jgi:hypothetical protein